MIKMLNQSTNYYYLVSGLPDIQRGESKGLPSLHELLSEILPQLSSDDLSLIRLVFSHYDNINFLNYLRNKESQLNINGFLVKSDLDELVSLMNDDENPKDRRLLPYILEYYRLTQLEDDFLKGIEAVDYLSGLYYSYGLKSENKFINSWFEFNLNLNNLLTAIYCRKHKINQDKYIVGDSEISNVLRTSNARDYGVGGLFEYTEEVIKLADEQDMLERENKIDTLKWSWLEDNTFFNYFTIEKIIAYCLKVEMLNRWKMLSFEAGSTIFRDILSSMKKEININA